MGIPPALIKSVLVSTFLVAFQTLWGCPVSVPGTPFSHVTVRVGD